MEFLSVKELVSFSNLKEEYFFYFKTYFNKVDGFNEACFTGSMKLINFFYREKGICRFIEGLENSVKGGHSEAVLFFLDKIDDRNVLNNAMVLAAEYGHMDPILYLIDKGANAYQRCLNSAAEGGHKELVDFFIKCGANNWNEAIRYSVRNEHFIIAQLLKDKRYKNKLNS